MSKRKRKANRALAADVTKAAPGFLTPLNGQAQSIAQTVALQRQYNRDFGVPTAQFGPGAPPPPDYLDEPPTQPRTWQYQVGWNWPSPPGHGRPVTYETLRHLADTYDLLRKGIEIRKDEICGLRFDVIARDRDLRRARQVVKEQQDKISEIRDFFTFPDKRRTWQEWLRALLEDYFVTDAVTIWKWRTLGGKLHGLRLLDGAKIKPLLDVQGERPLPPDPAYEQWIYGIARWNFSADELIYAPKNARIHTPYGFSPVEQFLLHINLCLREQRWVADYFTDGTLPEGVAEAPPSWSKDQITEFSNWWRELLQGDSRAFRQMQWVPAGFKFHMLKPFQFDEPFARWLVGYTAAALDVTAQELGFEPTHGGLGGKGFSEEQTKIQQRKSTGPIKAWLCDRILNPLIWTEFGAPDLVATLIGDDEEETELTEQQAIDLGIRNGTLSIDQVVEEEGGEPPGIGRVFVFGQSMVLGEPDLITITKEGWAKFQEGVSAASPKPPQLPTPQPGADAQTGQRAVEQTERDSVSQAHEQEQDQAPARRDGNSQETSSQRERGVAQKAATPYDYSSTQVDLDGEVAALVRMLGAAIPDEDLAADGREEHPHITVKYGLHTQNADDVRRAVEHEAPIAFKFGKTSIFPGGENSDYDVVKVDLDSEDLNRLNRLIADALPHTDTHPDYHPHATVAYVKKGLGVKHAGQTLLDGHPGHADAITFSSKTGEKTAIPLRGQVNKKTVADEVTTFLRFVSKRRRDGDWRDFTSDVLSQGTLATLNKAARAGASSDELRALVGMGSQPAAFKARVNETERTYRGLTAKVAAKVAEAVEARG